MNTKSIKQYILAGMLGCSTAVLTTSCNDFLDILPMNDVVLENFWTEKADVNSVVNSCYEALQESAVQERMGVWGELRSDNVIVGSNVPNNINEILKENLLETNEICDWSKFYTVINRCNIVCHYAPKVAAIDPNYTEDELRANIAEVSTLRALCYFYLIRAFRDVPYTTEPSIDDAQNYVLPATPFDAVLDSLIENLETVKDDAVRRYYRDDSPSAYQNSSRVTRWFTYTLLADLYLWKGEYDKAIAFYEESWAAEESRKPRFYDALEGIAIIHEIRSEWEKAADARDRILDNLLNEWGLEPESAAVRQAEAEKNRVMKKTGR